MQPSPKRRSFIIYQAIQQSFQRVSFPRGLGHISLKSCGCLLWQPMHAVRPYTTTRIRGWWTPENPGERSVGNICRSGLSLSAGPPLPQPLRIFRYWMPGPSAARCRRWYRPPGLGNAEVGGRVLRDLFLFLVRSSSLLVRVDRWRSAEGFGLFISGGTKGFRSDMWTLDMRWFSTSSNSYTTGDNTFWTMYGSVNFGANLAAKFWAAADRTWFLRTTKPQFQKKHCNDFYYNVLTDFR